MFMKAGAGSMHHTSASHEGLHASQSHVSKWQPPEPAVGVHESMSDTHRSDALNRVAQLLPSFANLSNCTSSGEVAAESVRQNQTDQYDPHHCITRRWWRRSGKNTQAVHGVQSFGHGFRFT